MIKNNYHTRIRAAAWVSVFLHVLLLLLAWWFRPPFLFGPSREEGPIEVTFLPTPAPEPQEKPQDRQLIDVAQPATEPVKPTDLIAVENSNASDRMAAPGDHPGPKVDIVDNIDSLGGQAGAVPVPPAPETPPAPPKPKQEPTPKPTETTREKKPEPKPEPNPATAETGAMTIAKAEPATEQPPQDAQTAAKPASPSQESPPGNGLAENRPSKGRSYRGVEKIGVQGFEALQDKIAPYLKKVEEAVEHRWREALLTKYSGSKATEVVIDCEIGADGKIVSLQIKGTPDDRVYAALCKEAIEKAGPFGPFPFTVPEVYRNRNLEIRWSFNFL